MAEGKSEPGPGEAIVPTVFADMTALGLGSTLRVVDKDFEIVGLSEGTFSMANSVIFVTRADVEDIMSSFDIVSFMLVTAADDVSADELAAAIEREVENVRALPAAVFLENDRQLAVQMGVETVALMTLICGALAVLLVAFTVYSQTVRQRSELAVAKALGVTNGALYASIAIQAGILALASALFASLLAWWIMPIVTGLVPMVSLQLTGASVIRIGVASVVVALIASAVPARRIARVDPVSAFHG